MAVFLVARELCPLVLHSPFSNPDFFLCCCPSPAKGHINEGQVCHRGIYLSSSTRTWFMRAAALCGIKTWRDFCCFLLLFLSHPQASLGCCLVLTKGAVCFRKNLSQFLPFVWFLVCTPVYSVKARGEELMGKCQFLCDWDFSVDEFIISAHVWPF